MPGFARRVAIRLEQAVQENGEDSTKEKLVSDLVLMIKMLEKEKARLEVGIWQGTEDLPRQLLPVEAEARLEAERARHAEAEAEWKKEERRLSAEMDHQRNSNERAQTMRVFLEKDPEHSALVKSLEARVDRFLSRNKAECVERVFNKHADEEQKLILPDRLGEALTEFGVHLPADGVQALMTTMDIDQNGGLDLKEFAAALRQPNTPVEQFLQTLPIPGMLASCLVPPESDSLKELCNLSSEQLTAAINAFSVSLEQELKKQLDLCFSKIRFASCQTCQTFHPPFKR